MSRLEIRLGRELRVAIPRADQLAVVAAVDAIADRTAELLGDRTVELDREIGDAASRIEFVGRHDRACRAGLDARGTAAAVRGNGLIDGQRQVREDLAEEEPRAVVTVEQVGVLADPAEARVACQRLFEHGGTVRECAITGAPRRCRQPVGQPCKPVAQHLVIVAAQRVAGNVAEAGVREHALGARRRRPVIHPRCDYPHGARHDLVGPRAARAVTRHVMHLAVPVRRQPVEQASFVFRQPHARNADLLEAEFAAPFLDLRGERCGIDAHVVCEDPGRA